MLDRSATLSEATFIAFDIETTGLSAVANRIVEIGAVRFRLDGTELDRFEQLIDPECAIPARVTHIHGITDRMVLGKPTIAAVLPRFIDFLGDSSTLLFAHNAMFDLSFLGLAMAKQGIAFPDHAIIDTLKLARSSVRGSPSFRLEDLAIHLGLAESEDHRGLSDSRLVVGLFQSIAERNLELATVGDLLDQSRPLSFSSGDSQQAVEMPPECQELTVAIAQNRTVVIIYEGGTRGPAQRRITPRSVVRSRGRAYLYAFCHRDRMEKTYRLDRIRDLRIETP